MFRFAQHDRTVCKRVLTVRATRVYLFRKSITDTRADAVLSTNSLFFRSAIAEGASSLSGGVAANLPSVFP